MSENRYYWKFKTGLTTHWRLLELSDSARWLYIVLLDFAAELDMNGKFLSQDLTKISQKVLQNRSNFSKIKYKKNIKKLKNVNLIDEDDECLYICKYAEHQPKLSSEAKRMRKYRENQALQKRNGVTLQKRNKSVLERERDKERDNKEKEKEKEKKIPTQDISKNPDVIMAKKITKQIHKILDNVGSTAIREKILRGGKLTVGAKKLIGRINQVQKNGVPSFPDLTSSDVESFFIDLVKMLGKNKKYCLSEISGNKSNLNLITIFGGVDTWNKYTEALLYNWTPPSRQKTGEEKKRDDLLELLGAKT